MARGRQPGEVQRREELYMELYALSEESAKAEVRKMRVLRELASLEHPAQLQAVGA